LSECCQARGAADLASRGRPGAGRPHLIRRARARAPHATTALMRRAECALPPASVRRRQPVARCLGPARSP